MSWLVFPSELARQVLTDAGLAGALLRCLRVAPRHVLTSPDPDDEDRLLAVTDFAGRLVRRFPAGIRPE